MDVGSICRLEHAVEKGDADHLWPVCGEGEIAEKCGDGDVAVVWSFRADGCAVCFDRLP